MNQTAVFQPIVSIDRDGNIDTEWSDSFIWVVDDSGNEVSDADDDTSDDAIAALDARLDQIKRLIEAGEPIHPDIIAPFFGVQS